MIIKLYSVCNLTRWPNDNNQCDLCLLQ